MSVFSLRRYPRYLEHLIQRRDLRRAELREAKAKIEANFRLTATEPISVLNHYQEWCVVVHESGAVPTG